MNEIKQICPKCTGTGVEQVATAAGGETTYSEVTCRTCGGSGKLSHSHLSDELITFLQDMSDKIDDLEDKIEDVLEILREA